MCVVGDLGVGVGIVAEETLVEAFLHFVVYVQRDFLLYQGAGLQPQCCLALPFYT